MKKMIPIFLVIVSIMLCSCGKSVDYDLSDNPIVFKSFSFENPDNKKDEYMAFEYKGRTYIPYGTVENTFDDVDQCLGYILQDDDTDKDYNDFKEKVFTLKTDKNNNYLATYIASGEMDQFSFWRATDTRNTQIDTPDYIYSLEYEFWMED